MPSERRLGPYLADRQRRLEAAGVPEARLNLEYLAARRLSLPRLDLILHLQDELSDSICADLDRDVERLRAGEPVQHILGDVPFHGLTIKTDSRALIPRPETEWLVDLVLSCGAVTSEPAPRVADVGTGTGCIALALAAALRQARVFAIDQDAAALSLARENRDSLGLQDRVELRQGDLLEGLPDGCFDAVVSNPPYIRTAVCGELDRHVREHEPRQALDGGPDGLEVIRRLAAQAIRRLKPGKPLWLEIGYDQGPAVKELLVMAGFERVEIRRDWSGHDRVACAWRPE